MPDRGADQRAGDAADEAGDDERSRVDSRDPDAAELGGDRLLGDRARREPEPRPVEQYQQPCHADDAHDEHQEQVAAERELPGAEHLVLEHRGVALRHAVGRVDDDLVDQQQHPDRRHQRRERVRERDEVEAGQVHEVAERAAGEE